MDRSLLQADPASVFLFGSLRLQADGTLFRGDEVIHLAPKELAALRVLLAHPGQVVTPAQLKDALWPDVHVTADSVPRCISSLRSHLGAEAHIRTVYKRGYRWESPVRHFEFPGQQAAPRLAIVPFARGMFVPEFLGTALAEDAGAHLLSFHPASIRILPRDAVFALAAQGMSPQEIGRKLAADLVVAGTVHASPLFLRVRAEMIRVEDGNQVWVEEVMSPRDQYAALEQRLLERLTCRLGGIAPVSFAASEPLADEPDGEAREALLLGRHECRSRDPRRMAGAAELLFKACSLNRGNQTAREQIVRLSVSQCLYGYITPTAAAEQVRHAADALPELDATSTAILPALGWIMFHVEHNLGFALRMIKDADAGPSTWPTTLRVMLALSRHRFQEARELLENALQDDPWSPPFNVLLAWAHHLGEQAEQSLEQAESCLTMFPGDERAELCAAVILAFNGQPQRAAELARSVVQNQPNLDIAAAILAYALAQAGRDGEARVLLENLQWIGNERFVLSSFTAAAYAALGDADAAIGELRAAEDARCPWFFQSLADPRLKSLDGNPKFERMRGILDTMEATIAPDTECVV